MTFTDKFLNTPTPAHRSPLHNVIEIQETALDILDEAKAAVDAAQAELDQFRAVPIDHLVNQKIEHLRTTNAEALGAERFEAPNKKDAEALIMRFLNERRQVIHFKDELRALGHLPGVDFVNYPRTHIYFVTAPEQTATDLIDKATADIRASIEAERVEKIKALQEKLKAAKKDVSNLKAAQKARIDAVPSYEQLIAAY